MQVLGSRFWVIGSKVVAQSATTTRSLSLRGMPTPAALGYRMPAEWEAHSATWLAWPHKEASWPGKLSSVQSVWVEVVQMLSVGETVEILVKRGCTGTAGARAARAGGYDDGSGAVPQRPDR